VVYIAQKYIFDIRKVKFPILKKEKAMTGLDT